MVENREIVKDKNYFCPFCKGEVRGYEETKGRKYTVHIACQNGCVHIQRATIIANDKDIVNKKKAISLAHSAWLQVFSTRGKWKK